MGDLLVLGLMRLLVLMMLMVDFRGGGAPAWPGAAHGLWLRVVGHGRRVRFMYDA